MTVKERDPLTVHLTTGHEWNGITELNTRVPRLVWIFIGITHIWALVVWVLLPAWPLFNTYTKGVLGITQKAEIDQAIAAGTAERAGWMTRVNALPAAAILADPVLAARVNGAGQQLFGDNCAACHGRGAAGGRGFPNLADNIWIWGNNEATITETLRVGINSTHPETRVAQMPAFGKDALLTPAEVAAVVDHTRSLSSAKGPAAGTPGAALFAANCASCHGDAGKGNTELGAPNLTDRDWIYGGNRKSVHQSIWQGRQGWMPSWDQRLTPAERKILTVHILARTGVQPS